MNLAPVFFFLPVLLLLPWLFSLSLSPFLSNLLTLSPTPPLTSSFLLSVVRLSTEKNKVFSRIFPWFHLSRPDRARWSSEPFRHSQLHDEITSPMLRSKGEKKQITTQLLTDRISFSDSSHVIRKKWEGKAPHKMDSLLFGADDVPVPPLRLGLGPRRAKG